MIFSFQMFSVDDLTLVKVLGPQSSGCVCIGYCRKLLAWYQIQSVQEDGCFGAKEGGRAWERGYLPVRLHDALTSFPDSPLVGSLHGNEARDRPQPTSIL